MQHQDFSLHKALGCSTEGAVGIASLLVSGSKLLTKASLHLNSCTVGTAVVSYGWHMLYL